MKITKSPYKQRALYAAFVVLLWSLVLLADKLENSSVPVFGMLLWVGLYAIGYWALWVWLPKVGLPKWQAVLVLIPVFGLLFITLTACMPFKKQSK